MSTPPTAQPNNGELPKFVGKYRIVRLIAKSNDTVYEAIDPHLNRHIALKELTLPPNLSGAAKRERIERFQREAKAAGALTHPNIVTIYEVGQHLEHRFIAMEYLIGQTLREVLTVGGPLPVLEAIDIALQLCEALGYAHQQGVVHRDVKPDNIYLVAPSRTVKLTDFGIARMMAEPALTSAGQVFGTPAYMSPEQLSSREVDYRSDIFSLGVVLYEMLGGHKPFQGANIYEITHRILNAEPEMPAAFAPGLASIIARALAKDPDLRYQSLRALTTDLRREQQALQEMPALEQAAALAAAARTRAAAASAVEPTLYSAAAQTEAIPAEAPESEDATRSPKEPQPQTFLLDDLGPAGDGTEATEYRAYDDGSKPSDVFRTTAANAPASLTPLSPSAAFLAELSADAALRAAALRLLAIALAAAALIAVALFGLLPGALARLGQERALSAASASYAKAGRLASSGDLDDAISGYKTALQSAGESNALFSARCRQGLADCYIAEAARAQASGNLQAAQLLYTQATMTDPGNATALYDSATAARAAGDEISALRGFTQAHESQPSSPAGLAALDAAQQGYLRLGEQAVAQSDMALARQNWQTAENLSPQTPTGQQATARLQQTLQ